MNALPFDMPDLGGPALCAETDPESFFPEKGHTSRAAKLVCAGCEVRAACLEWALSSGERFGVWGGLSERERQRLRAQMPVPRKQQPISHGTESGYKQHRRRGVPMCDPCRDANRMKTRTSNHRRKGTAAA